MRHRKASLKLNRTSSHREAMFRNMVTSLFKHDRIKTTDVKAKELRRWADNLITLAKRNDVHARRQALSILREKEVVHKLFAEANEKYASRSGGYTRIVKMGRRPGDAAPISMVELIFTEGDKKKRTKKKKVAKATAAKRKVAKKIDVKEESMVEETETKKSDIEDAQTDEDDKKVEQVSPDDKAVSSEPDTDSEDTDKNEDDQTLETVELEASGTEEKQSEDDQKKPETKE